MGEILESQWSQGWTPSSAEQGNLSADTKGLLKMDNLTLDELGNLRSTNGWQIEEPFVFDDIIGIFSTTLPNIGVQRYVFDASGNVYRMAKNSTYTGIGPFFPFAPTVVTSATGNRAAFVAILGHVFIIIGSTKKKDRGDVTFDLGVPAPSAPSISLTAPPSIDLNNLDGSNHYTNWTSVDSSAFTNTGTEIDVTPGVSSLRAVTQTVFSSTIDTTNFGGGTGKQADNDLFTFNFEIDDASQLWFVRLEFFHENPTTTTPTHYYWFEWDFLNPPIPNSPYPPFNVISGASTRVSVQRNQFFDYNFDPTKDWSNIKCIRFTIGMKIPDGSPVNCTISGLTVTGGLTSQINNTGIQYIAVAARDTGSYLEFSQASTPTTAIDDVSNWNITVTPAGAVDAQANQYWLFRLDNVTGVYLLVDKQTGADGFTPTAFIDGRPSADLISDATINPFYTLQFYRTTLPNTIIDMIWFRDRMIYLTPDSFIPSFQLDPGSYDSRYIYQIAGGSSNAEVCLFIIKLDVGNFIVGTTKDFYRVTGTFTLSVDPITGLTLQDVNIYPLGVSNPPISRAHAEFAGSIIYIASDGVRMLTNFVSSSINDGLDLLFKNETRYDLSPVHFAPNDTAPFAMTTRDKRIYITMPHKDGINRVYVCTFETSGYNPLNYSRYWRLITFGDVPDNPTTFFTEEDGTILFGSLKRQSTTVPAFNSSGYLNTGGNYLRSIESGPRNSKQHNLNKMNQQAHVSQLDNLLPIKFKTDFNYGGNPEVRKDATSLKIGGLDSHNISGNIAIYGLTYDGNINKVLLQFVSYGESILEIDLEAEDGFGNSLGSCIAYAIEIGCLTDRFSISYFSISYDERPQVSRRKLFIYNDLENYGRKRVEAWPFHVDPMTLANIVRVIARVDGFSFDEQTFTGKDYPTDLVWMNPIVNGNFGTNWELEVYADDSMEFYKFGQPVIAQQMPGSINYVIKPSTNFGKSGPKKIAAWPFVCNPLTKTGTIKVTIDGAVQATQTFTGNRIQTFYWYNTQDIMGVDWQIEVYMATPGDTMEFYGFLDPEVLQIFPCPKEFDQIGPFDLNAKGLVTGMRIRAYPTDATLNYIVYADDINVLSDSITVTVNVDESYIVTFPKGIDPSVCRITFSASALFYRFSVELRVRETGRETEEKFVKVLDKNA